MVQVLPKVFSSPAQHTLIVVMANWQMALSDLLSDSSQTDSWRAIRLTTRDDHLLALAECDAKQCIEPPISGLRLPRRGRGRTTSLRACKRTEDGHLLPKPGQFQSVLVMFEVGRVLKPGWQFQRSDGSANGLEFIGSEARLEGCPHEAGVHGSFVHSTDIGRRSSKPAPVRFDAIWRLPSQNSASSYRRPTKEDLAICSTE